MERLTERLETARRALADFEELASKAGLTLVERDAAIQRFEYTFEAAWKAAQVHLREVEGLEVGSPKGVVRASLQVGLLDEAQARLALEMVDDRNLTSRTYNPLLAEAIARRLATYAALLRDWLDALARSPSA